MLWRKWAKSDVKSVFRRILMVPWAFFLPSAPRISFQKLQSCSQMRFAPQRRYFGHKKSVGIPQEHTTQNPSFHITSTGSIFLCPKYVAGQNASARATATKQAEALMFNFTPIVFFYINLTRSGSSAAILQHTTKTTIRALTTHQTHATNAGHLSTHNISDLITSPFNTRLSWSPLSTAAVATRSVARWTDFGRSLTLP